MTRLSSTLNGHSEAVLSVLFSPDGKHLASGSGDTTVRVWDMLTGISSFPSSNSQETPKHTLKGHVNWVQQIAWSPDCSLLVSAGMDSTIRLWDPKKGTEIGLMKGHAQPVTALCFEPMHLYMRLVH